MKSLEAIMKFSKRFIKLLVENFYEDEVTGLSAQLAYFLLLSIFPLMIFGITLLAYMPISTPGVLNSFNKIVPGDTFQLIEGVIVSVLETKRGDILSLSILITLWTASNGMSAIIRSLNKAYNVKNGRGFIYNKLISILLVLGIVSAIGIALVLSVFGNVIGKYIFTYFGLKESFLFFWSIIRILGSFIILLVVFALLYLIAPNKRLKIQEIYVGTIFAALGWVLVSFLFSFYVNNFGNFSSTYGSLGGVIVLMIWLYLSGMILILGGEINATLYYLNGEQES